MDSGRYHVDGDLVLVPAEDIDRQALNLCRLIFVACQGHRVLILSPLSRYVPAGCCHDPDHALNRQLASQPCLQVWKRKKKAMTAFAYLVC
jgi:hypothetical protein